LTGNVWVANEDYTQGTLSGADAAPQNDETLKISKIVSQIKRKRKQETLEDII
jgi:hypothetical protein